MNKQITMPKDKAALPATGVSPRIWIPLLAVYIFWGSTYLAIMMSLESLPPFFMAALRFLVAGTLMFVWLAARGVSMPTLEEWRSAAVIGTLLLAGGNGCVVWAQQTVSTGLAALLVSMVPLWMLIFDWIRPAGPRPTSTTIAALLLGFGGLVMLIRPAGGTDFGGTGAGLLALIVAPMSWALGSVYSRRAKMPVSPFMSTAAQMLAGGFVLIILSLLTREWQGLRLGQVTLKSWGGLLYLVVFGSLLAFTAYIWLLKNAPLPLVSTYAYVNPLIAIALGWLFTHETLRSREALAALMILACVVMITTVEAKKSSSKRNG